MTMTQLTLVRDDVQTPAPPIVVLKVLGTPAPKGSSRAFYKAGMKRAVIVKDNSDRQRSWEGAVREAALEKLGELVTPRFVDAQLEVQVCFYLARPAGHWGKGKNAGKLTSKATPRPRGTPDIDKLVRSTLDALTGSVFDDDSRIVRIVAEKRYAAPGQEGAEISIGELVEASV